MWKFLKTIAQAIYHHTVGGFVRLCRHTSQAKVDQEDKLFLGRLITYSTLAVLTWFFPVLGVVIGVLRAMVIADVLGMVTNVFQETVNSYA